MINHINKKNIGKLAVTLSLLIWLADRLTHTISALLGKIICGDHHLHIINATISDPSCEFNIDMHLKFSLTIIFIFGILLYISSHKEIE